MPNIPDAIEEIYKAPTFEAITGDTGYPPFMGSDPISQLEAVKAEQQFQHNWLYSVVPAVRFNPYENQGISSSTDVRLVPMLAGYCRHCNNGFTVELPRGDFGVYAQENMNIPKFGCVSPIAGL